MRDGVEYRNYGSNLSATNTDGDVCADGKELATVDRNTTVNAADLGNVAGSFGPTTDPDYIVNYDIDKNGTINASDLGQVAARFGSC